MKKNESNPESNLLIDCTYIKDNNDLSDSLAFYGCRLIKGFLRYGHYTIHVLLWRDIEARLDNLVGEPFDKIILDKDEIPARYLRSYNRLRGILPPGLKDELRRRSIQKVLLPSHYNSFFHFLHPFTQYTVVHDLFYIERNREFRGKMSYLKWRIRDKLSLRLYRHLITISKVVQDDVRHYAGKNSRVLYNSLAFDFDIPEKTVEGISGKPYILDVNSLQERKNTAALIRALGMLKDRFPHVLYLKVKSNLYFEEIRQRLERLASDYGVKDRVIFDSEFRTVGELRYLYTHADLFVSPSLLEGFGWTPIEAAILKTPVLVSDIDIFKEVTCGKIPTFDPRSPEDLAAHIQEILMNPPTLEKRTELADFFLETYSLKKQIERLEAILA